MENLLFMLQIGGNGSEMLDKIDPLVKLANVGAAGIAVLAVFMTGFRIFNLPNDTSKVKENLLKRFMSMCIIMTIICGLTGVASAWFNRSRIVEAEKKTENLVRTYEFQMEKIESEKNMIMRELQGIRGQVHNTPQANPEVLRSLDNAEMKIREMKLLPVEQMIGQDQKSPRKRMVK